MASCLSHHVFSPLEEDLTCPVCCEIFSEPVLLSCSHSFCRKCLEQSWKDKQKKECPVCRQQASSEEPPLNLALKNACEFVVKERSAGASRASQGVCPVHLAGKLQLFCVDDQQLVCVECVAGDHQRHNFCSISKVAEERREELKIKQQTLQEKLDSVKKAKNIYGLHFESQVQKTARQIREEFKMLHIFLRKEEEARIAALREEEQKKKKKLEQKITKMEREIKSLTEKIEAITDGLASEDVPFLNKYTETKESAEYTVPDLKLDSGALINVAKHLGNLRYSVWEKMKDICPYFSVILDPNSANGSLTLSDDLSRLIPEGPVQALPNNPERFTGQTAVLGSEGFTSGVHSWAVELGESEGWKIGVAKMSVKRKMFAPAYPGDGIWAVQMNDEQYFWNYKFLNVQKIRVQLDCDEEEVTFFDNYNRQLAAKSFRVTEKLYPFFFTTSTCALRILPFKVTVKKN